jgi:hypothetical protein
MRTFNPSERSDIKYTLMQPPVYQDVINLVMCSSLRKGPSVFMNAAMREHGTFDMKVVRCGKVYYSNSIIITNFVTLISDFCLENIFDAYFHTIITQQNFHILLRKLIKYTSYFLKEAVLYIIALIYAILSYLQKLWHVINLKTGLKTQGNIIACCTH